MLENNFLYFVIIYFFTFVITFAIYNNIILTPQYEWGDFAVNGLNILRASNFKEIYGNYSRWGFNHPGPYFFYLYALGEFIFFKTFHIFKTPMSSHIFTLFLHQILFFSLSMLIIKKLINNIKLTIFIYVIILSLFIAAEHSFVSIWPPHQFIMPYFCFLISSLAVIKKTINYAILMIFSGCIVIHSHISQPLFVLIIWGFVLITILYYLDFRIILSRYYKILLSSFFIAIIFFLPIYIDLVSDGYTKNIEAIVNYLLIGKTFEKSILDVILYYMSFFVYWLYHPALYSHQIPDINIFLNSKTFVYQIIIIVLYLALLVMIIINSIKFKKNRQLFTFIILIISLNLIWGLKQRDFMYAFNAYYFYSVIAFLIVASFLIIDLKHNLMKKTLVFSLINIMIFNVFAIYRVYDRQNYVINATNDAIIKTKTYELNILKGIINNYNKVFIHFNDNVLWPRAAEIALFLARNNIEVCVEPHWKFMFCRRQQYDYSFMYPHLYITKKDGDIKFGDNFGIIVDMPPKFIKSNYKLTINELKKLLFYQCEADCKFIWLTDKNMSFLFSGAKANFDKKVDFKIVPFLFKDKNLQRVIIETSNLKKEFRITKEDIISIHYTKDEWNNEIANYGGLKVKFYFPTAFTPVSVGLNKDPRLISIGLKEIEINDLQ